MYQFVMHLFIFTHLCAITNNNERLLFAFSGGMMALGMYARSMMRKWIINIIWYELS